MPADLHYYLCRNCKAVLISGYNTKPYERCRDCRSWMKHQFSEPVLTEEQRMAAWRILKHGPEFRRNPNLAVRGVRPEQPKPEPLTPVDMAENRRAAKEKDERMRRLEEEQQARLEQGHG